MRNTVIISLLALGFVGVRSASGNDDPSKPQFFKAPAQKTLQNLSLASQKSNEKIKIRILEKGLRKIVLIGVDRQDQTQYGNTLRWLMGKYRTVGIAGIPNEEYFSHPANRALGAIEKRYEQFKNLFRFHPTLVQQAYSSGHAYKTGYFRLAYESTVQSGSLDDFISKTEADWNRQRSINLEGEYTIDPRPYQSSLGWTDQYVTGLRSKRMAHNLLKVATLIQDPTILAVMSIRQVDATVQAMGSDVHDVTSVYLR